MATHARIAQQNISVEGRPARVFVGGSGSPLLLVHGGWGGASMHFSQAWNGLAEHHRVIAPDLPGIGDTDTRGLGSVAAYARWLRALLDALEVRSAWLLGNSFGASVVIRLAADVPTRCRGLVLVNGLPMPRTPPLLRWLGTRPFGHRMLTLAERRVAYSSAALGKGFVDPRRAPHELRRVVSQSAPAQLEALVDVLVAGDDGPACPVAPLLLWGADDRLPGTDVASARKLCAGWPGSRLELISGAGHLPQLEQPAAFIAALEAFIARHVGLSPAAPTGSAASPRPGEQTSAPAP